MANSPAYKPTIYSDFRTGFDAHPITGDLVLVKNEDSVINAIKNICYTSAYERPFNSGVSGGVRGSLFELPSAITSDSLKTALTFAIKNNERRISNLDVQVYYVNDNNSYAVTITFAVANNDRPITFTHYLERLR